MKEIIDLRILALSQTIEDLYVHFRSDYSLNQISEKNCSTYNSMKIRFKYRHICTCNKKLMISFNKIKNYVQKIFRSEL